MAEEKKLVFGVGSVNQPTPTFMKTIFRVVSLLVGIWALVQHMNLGLNEKLIGTINEWAVAALPIIHYVIKFFRWDYNTDTNE